jgi:hypothetical protein
MFSSEYIKAYFMNKNFYLLFIFYLIAHGGILLIPNAIYWDDWSIYRVAPEVILDTFSQAGTMFNFAGYLHISLLSIGPWIYKGLTFLLMFASGLLLNQILKRYISLQSEYKFFIVLLFLVLPFNIARVALIDFGYTLGYFLFFLAWMLMDRYRATALVLFFLSFNINSLLVFYALPILDALYRSGLGSSLKSMSKFVIERIDYMLLPFVYFFIKIYFFSPSGNYKGYNENYSVRNLLDSSITQYYDFLNLFKIIAHPGYVGIGLCVLLSVITFWLIRKQKFDWVGSVRASWGGLALGFVALFLGVFPYWIIGKAPIFYEWASRHQLLMPLGSAIIIVGLLSIIGRFREYAQNNSIYALVPTFLNRVIISIIVGISLAFNVSAYAGFYGDWQKQKQLVHLFSNNQDIQRAGLIIVEDMTEDINGLKRRYRFYEWNALMQVAFGNETRFVVPRRDYNAYISGKLDKTFQNQYKAGSFHKDNRLDPIFVEINLNPAKSFKQKIEDIVTPNLTIMVSKIDLATFKEVRE